MPAGGRTPDLDLPPAVIDDAGDTVRLAVPARRIVSLIPSTTELLFLLGAGPRVVGRTTWCDYPTAALPGALAAHGIGVRTLVPGYPAVLEKVGAGEPAHFFSDLFGGPATITMRTLTSRL